MGVAIRLALAGLALAVAVLGPLAAQAVTITWAVDAKWSGGGPADAALGAPDARFGRSGSLALGRGGAAFFDFGGAFSGSAYILQAGWPGGGRSRGFDRAAVGIYVSKDPMSAARQESFVKVGGAGGFLAPRGTRLELPPGVYRTLAVVDSGRSWRSDGFRLDAVGVSEVAAIPLPMTASLMAAGLLGLAVIGRGRGARGSADANPAAG